MTQSFAGIDWVFFVLLVGRGAFLSVLVSSRGWGGGEGHAPPPLNVWLCCLISVFLFFVHCVVCFFSFFSDLFLCLSIRFAGLLFFVFNPSPTPKHRTSPRPPPPRPSPPPPPISPPPPL